MVFFVRNAILWGCLLSLVGCTSGLRSWTRHDDAQRSAEACARPQIERGQPRPVIDGIGWVVGIPSKIILWDRRVDNHKISPKTEQAITQYVGDLGLAETKVRLNQYAPIDEWRRLTSNQTVGWGWRYTLGVVVWLDEAIFPGRVYGGDHYNPFTNTVSIYSDAPAIAVKEGSRARDVRSRRFPGTYAAVNSLPLVSMWYETVSTNYAMDYLHHDSPEAEQEGFHLLYPAFGAHLGNDIASFTPIPNIFGAAVGAIPGHVIGRYRGQKQQPRETAMTQTSEPESPR